MDTKYLSTRCCIVGGGPAGVMLGFLLARAGVDVVVLEKHADFLRDFRGDTIHPSTLELMHELGLLDEFLKLPHREVRRLAVQIGATSLTIADFTQSSDRLQIHRPHAAMGFSRISGRAWPPFSKGFHLMMETSATDLILDGDRVVGVRALSETGAIEIRADLVVGADGRRSTVRSSAGFKADNLGAPMDVLWMRLSRRPDDGSEAFGHVEGNRMFIMLDRGDYWQCAFVIPKGSADELMKTGIGAFRGMILEMSPWLGERVNELKAWNDVKLLTVAVDRLRRWHRPGLLCIGDAAHAMSPIGGVGINLAVQDAVAAANILAEPLRGGTLTDDHLARVQARREWPTRVTQSIQLAIQNRVVRRVLASTAPSKPPFILKLLDWLPALRGIPARLVGIGARPEHVRIGEATPTSD